MLCVVKKLYLTQLQPKTSHKGERQWHKVSPQSMRKWKSPNRSTLVNGGSGSKYGTNTVGNILVMLLSLSEVSDGIRLENTRPQNSGSGTNCQAISFVTYKKIKWVALHITTSNNAALIHKSVECDAVLCQRTLGETSTRTEGNCKNPLS